MPSDHESQFAPPPFKHKLGTKPYRNVDDEWRARDYDRLGFEHAPCCWCGRPSQAYRNRPDETQCNGCWETTSRLGDFLRLGPDSRAFVREVLGRYPDAD